MWEAYLIGKAPRWKKRERRKKLVSTGIFSFSAWSP
jgi:hypothetical protein